MRIETFPLSFRWDRRFPGARLIVSTQFEQVYAAEGDGKYYLIYDGGVGAELGLDFWNDDVTQQLAAEAVLVFEFDSARERDTYRQVHSPTPDEVDFDSE